MKSVIQDKIQVALEQLGITGADIEVTYTDHPEHGDYASNVAMKLAKQLKRAPLDIGNELAEKIDRAGIEKIDVIAPGFLNFFVNEKFLAGGVRLILEQGERYGENTSGQGKQYLVEFLSANPTGPIHLGNGRAGFTGDVLVRVLRASGYNVIAEYIINDYGKQLDTLAESVLRRYMQNQGVKMDYPDELYKGEYIKELADRVQPTGPVTELHDEIKEWALKEMVKQIQEFVENTLHIHYDAWQSERSLYDPKKVEAAKQWLKEHDLIYTLDGATWFASTKFGDDKDRVIIKGNGENTYFFSDILYLIDKFEVRKIDHWIWYLGADHHGYEGRMQAALSALGHAGKLDIIFVQLVRLMFNGKEMRMSKRKGTFITLEELVEEIGIDVTRWFFLMYDANTHMDFDLNLAREQSDNNPVFYVQYAYARICSLLAKAGNQAPGPIQFVSDAEEQLAKQLFQLPDVVIEIAGQYGVHKLPQYAIEVARAFHRFYTMNRVIEADGSINVSRYQLVQATQVVLRNALLLMGITAPEKM